ncbi:MAG: DUF3382 domain-containing protein, partial [Rhizobiales bacterium]|nr:DUF3382 domain-containing protein [Hyphomicrobiales bacterium]
MAEATPKQHGPDFSAAVKDALLSGLIALGLFGPLVGLRTEQNIRNELVVQGRWGLLASVIAVIVVGRFLLLTLVWPAMAARKERAAPASDTPSPLRQAVSRWFAPASLVFLFLYPAIIVSLLGFQGSLKWVDNFGIQILIYVMLGWGLNIVVGLAGLLDLGYVAFYAVGAYSYA